MMLVAYIVVGVVISIVLVLLAYIKWRFNYWALRKIPFIPPKIPFGNHQRDQPFGVHIKRLYDEAQKRGLKHCGLFFFANPVYLVIDLDYLKNIMTKDFRHFSDRGMYYNEKDDPISAHLFAIGGHRWKDLRNKISPTFTSKKLKEMFPILLECVSLLMEAMDRGLSQFNVKEMSGRFTMDVIGSCAFGLDCQAIKEEHSPFRINCKKVFYTSRMRTLRMILASNFPNLGHWLGIRQVPKEVSDFFRQSVKETIEYRQDKNFVRHDFMQLLIDLKNEDGSNLSLEEIVAQSFIFFLGGFETSSTTMTFTLYELAKNTQIQETLRREIFTVLARFNNEITYEAIHEMKYLDQVIDESLRKYPPFPFITRKCVEDYKIPDEEKIIEKGRRIFISIMGIHYDERYYPEPDKFDPERFSDINKQNLPQFAYIPFGEGPRICIGQRFGTMQTKVGLVALLQNYRFIPNPKTREPLKFDKKSFVPAAEGGIWLDAIKI